MAYQLTNEAVIGGKSIVYVDAPFDKGYHLIASRNGKIITGRDLAHGRIQTGAGHSLSQSGSYIREGILYDTKGEARPLLLSVSSILENTKKATQAHRGDKEYFPTEKTVETYRNQAEEDMNKNPEDRRVLILAQTENFEIPTDRFNEEETTLWLFKDQAKAYGDYLKVNGIKKMLVWLVGKSYTKDQKKPFERQLWLHRRFRSELVGYYRRLDYYIRVRGVSRGAVTAEGGSQKILESASESYTQEQISDALESLELKGLEQLILDQLKQKD